MPDRIFLGDYLNPKNPDKEKQDKPKKPKRAGKFITAGLAAAGALTGGMGAGMAPQEAHAGETARDIIEGARVVGQIGTEIHRTKTNERTQKEREKTQRQRSQDQKETVLGSEAMRTGVGGISVSSEETQTGRKTDIGIAPGQKGQTTQERMQTERLENEIAARKKEAEDNYINLLKQLKAKKAQENKSQKSNLPERPRE